MRPPSSRRLQPSMVVPEDVDLIAMDRDFSDGQNPLLFTLLDAMDGVGVDADVPFVLTTNRADIAATEGVTASYIKELVRRAVLAALRAGERLRSCASRISMMY